MIMGPYLAKSSSCTCSSCCCYRRCVQIGLISVKASSVHDYCGRVGWRSQCILCLLRQHPRGTVPRVCRLWVSSSSAMIFEMKRITHNHPVVAGCGEGHCIRARLCCEQYLIVVHGDDINQMRQPISRDLRDSEDPPPVARICSAKPKRDD